VAEIEVTAGIAYPLGPVPPLTPPFEWTQFAHYPNPWAACIVAGLLENEGVVTYIESTGIFGEVNGFSILRVPQPLAHRARWIPALAPPTESELVFLATGELNSDQRP
jgi:hypothetical protein